MSDVVDGGMQESHGFEVLRVTPTGSTKDGPAGEGSRRYLLLLLVNTDWDGLRERLAKYVEGRLPEGSELVIGGERLQMLGDSGTEARPNDRTTVRFREVDTGVLVATRAQGVAATVARICRLDNPYRAHAGAGVVTQDARFFDNPRLVGPEYLSYCDFGDSRDAAADRGFVVDVAADRSETFLYLPEGDESEVAEVVQSGWIGQTWPEPTASFLRVLEPDEDLAEDSIADDIDGDNATSRGDVTLLRRVRECLPLHKNVLIDGVAGSGKSHLREVLEAEYSGRVEFAVFHPSTTYEDFVRGMRPSFGEAAREGGGEFVVTDGLFVQICDRAWNAPDEEFLLFIDEINRANTSRVLGDLLFAMEKSKRVAPGSDGEKSCVSKDPYPGAVRLQIADQNRGLYLRVPSNLHILGTMNSTDRSVGTLDLALQRRFYRIGAQPMSVGELRDALALQGVSSSMLGEPEDGEADAAHRRGILTWYGTLNDRLQEYVGPDARVGHAYFFKNLPDPNLPDDDYQVADYQKGVVTAILDQVAEIVRAFAVDRETVKEIMEGLPHRLDIFGEGLGAAPVPKPSWVEFDSVAERVIDQAGNVPISAPSPGVRKSLYDAIREMGAPSVSGDDATLLYRVFDLLGHDGKATSSVDGGTGNDVVFPLKGGRIAEVGKMVLSIVNENRAEPRTSIPDVPIRCYNSLMWGVPIAYSYREQLRSFTKNQFIEPRSRFLTAEALAHLDGVIRSIDDAEAARSAGAEARHCTEVIEHLRNRTNVLLEGVAGSGKSHLLGELVEEYGKEQVEFVVFHPSTTYEDFVRGVRPVVDGRPDAREFEIVDGLFLEMCKKAWESARKGEGPDGRGMFYLLFIDEINRANTARVLGDLLCVIEDSKRVDPAGLAEGEDPESCLTARSRTGAVRLLVDDDKHPGYLRVPSNLHILGTMNSTDRSVGSLDLALQRRFYRAVQKPMSAEALRIEIEAEARSPLPDDFVALIDWYGKLNERLREKIGPDALVGHSYFFPDDTKAVPDLDDVSERIFAQLVEITRIFARDDEVTLKLLTPSAGDGRHPRGWYLELRGKRLGRLPVLVKAGGDSAVSSEGPGE